MKLLCALCAVVGLASTSAAIGHEFWLSPQDYTVADGENVVVHIRVGQMFEGPSYSYLPPQFVRFDAVHGETVVPVQRRMGDRPAMKQVMPEPGLWVIVHETTDSRLTWDDWEKFVGFVEHKDLGDTLARHAARGLPQTGFREAYRRFAKSLVAVGDAGGSDRVMGLRTEFVAGANPYAADFDGVMPVTLLFEGAPRADARIEVFDRDLGGEVTSRFARTDADGRAEIPVEPGHEYLFDAVVMLPLEATDLSFEPVWESLWASLTFQVPR